MSPASLVPASSLRSVLTLVTAAACLVMGMVAISWVIRLASIQWLAASLATAAMGGLTVWLATRSPLSPGASIGRTVGWALLLGLANVPASFMAACLVEDIELQMFVLALMATFIGAPFGLGLGLLFGVVLSVPVAAFMRAWQRPSPDASDASLTVSGLWLALVAGLVVMLDWPRIDPELDLWSAHAGDPLRSLVLRTAAWVLGGTGMALAAAAGLRRAARRRFIARVCQGLVPAWKIAEAPPAPDRSALGDLPRLGGTLADCEHLLLRCEHTGDGAYRRAASEWSVAWVPRTWLSRSVVTPPRA
jgi:hypothetical protein